MSETSGPWYLWDCSSDADFPEVIIHGGPRNAIIARVECDDFNEDEWRANAEVIVNAPSLRDRVEKAERERDEARKALRWLAGAYAGMRDRPEAPEYVIATVRLAIAARAAEGGEDE